MTIPGRKYLPSCFTPPPLGFMPRRTKRAFDLPLQGRILKEGKGKYAVQIVFTKSKRHYHDELVFAKDQKAVKAHIKLLYPTLTWRKK